MGETIIDRIRDRAETWWHVNIMCPRGRHRPKFGLGGRCRWCGQLPTT